MLRKRERDEQETSYSQGGTVKKSRSFGENSHAIGVDLRLAELETPLVPAMQEREAGILSRAHTQGVRRAKASLNFSALPQSEKPTSDPTPMVLPSSPQIYRPATMAIPQAAVVLPELALFDTPKEVGGAEESQPEVVSTSKDEVEIDAGISAVSEGTPKKDKYSSPLKLHEKALHIGDKPGGINEGYIGNTPSKREYMVKPETPKSRVKVLIEYIMSAVYLATVDNRRVPKVQLSRHISMTASSPKFSVLSPIIKDFTPLKDASNSGSEKPVYFENLLLTSMLAGNPDGHNQNLGFDGAGELVQIDFDRCLAVQFKNGSELLDFIKNFCVFRGYLYDLSFREMINHITYIETVGIQSILKSVKDRVDQFSREGYEVSSAKPLKFWKYKIESFCATDLIGDKILTFSSLASFFEAHVATLLISNFKALVEVKGILEKVFERFEGIQIANKITSKDKLCASFSELVSSKTPIEQTVCFEPEGQAAAIRIPS